MEAIDIVRLQRDEHALATRFQAARPFKYVIIDDFLRREAAIRIHSEYPAIDQTWIDSNGMNTRGKWASPVLAGSVADTFFREVNSPAFRSYLGRLTGINDLIEDPKLHGAGFHQIRDGGFLNVHVDFNRLGELHRRLNLIVYMNPDWRDEYGGNLELWDMASMKRIENIPPVLNRCVIFETNEVSFHGHPVPLKTGALTRKSLSIYYYTETRHEIAVTHNTLYVNTHGLKGAIRVCFNGIAHLRRKIRAKLGR